MLTLLAIGAGIAVLSGVGAGVGIGIATSKASAAVARQPESDGKVSKLLLLGSALAEATAIYGFVVGLLIILLINPDTNPAIMAIGAGVAVLTGAGAGIGIGLATGKACECAAKNPEADSKISKVLLLGSALAEATAIYGFVIGLLIILLLGDSADAASVAVGAGAAVFTGIGAGIGIGLATAGACEAVSKAPDADGKVSKLLLLGSALAEATAIYGFVIGLLIILLVNGGDYSYTLALGAGIAVIAGVGAGVGIGLATRKACLAVAENPDVDGKISKLLLLGSALSEATAIYGFVVALLIILLVDPKTAAANVAIGAGLAVMTGIGAGFGIGFAASKACESVAASPESDGKISKLLLLGSALSEATAIYGFVVGLLIILLMGGNSNAVYETAFGSGLAVFTGIGAGIGIGIATAKSCDAVGRVPEADGKISKLLLLGSALAEATAIYGFVVGLLVILLLGAGENAAILSFGSGLAVLAGLGAGLGIGCATSNACCAVADNPDADSKVSKLLLLGSALSEATAIYGFVIGLLILLLFDPGKLNSIAAIGAGAAVLSGLGAGIGIGLATARATSAVAKQPEADGKVSKLLLLGSALAEATAIYGFVVGLLIILLINPDTSPLIMALGSGLAVLTGAGAGIGIGLATGKACDSVALNPEADSKISKVLLLGSALAEATAIYGFVIGLLVILLLSENADAASVAVGAGLAVFTGIGAGIGIGMATAGACEAVAKSPDADGKVSKLLLLGSALAEATAIYGFVIGLLIILLVNGGEFSYTLSLGAGLAVLAGVGAGVGIGYATRKSCLAVAQNPEVDGKISKLLLLGSALSEATAIYGFVVALLIILLVDPKEAVAIVSTGAGLAVLTGIGAGFGIGLAAAKACNAVSKAPDTDGKVSKLLLLGSALSEATAIYGFVVGLLIILLMGGKTDAVYQIAFGSGLAVFTGIGAGAGIGLATSKSCEAVGRVPEADGRISKLLLLGSALAEATAIYGFVVGLLIILILGAGEHSEVLSFGSGLAVLAGLGAGLGIGYATSNACTSVAHNPRTDNKVSKLLLLGSALSEATAIYGFVVGLLILLLLNPDKVNAVVAIGSGIAVVTGLGAGFGIGSGSAKSCVSVARQPHADGKISKLLLLGSALAEATAIYGFVIGLLGILLL